MDMRLVAAATAMLRLRKREAEMKPRNEEEPYVGQPIIPESRQVRRQRERDELKAARKRLGISKRIKI